MKQLFAAVLIVAFALLTLSQAKADDKVTYKYVGTKICAPCHKAEKTGNQFGIWQKSKHSEAMKTLAGPKAAEIAKAKGLKTTADKAAECVDCHQVTADPAVCEKTFSAADGVQCEACHGPGSGYKTLSVMKDKAKAVAAGLILYKDDAAIEAKCKTCHNEKSPTFKAFDFKASWAKIKHSVPKKG